MEPSDPFERAAAYRSIWRHEDEALNQRVNRFWLMNGAFFVAILFIFCSQNFTNFLSDSFYEVQEQKSSETCDKLKASFNQPTFTVKTGASSSPRSAQSVILSKCFRLKWVLVLFISVIGTLNALIFVYQTYLGTKVFHSINEKYDGNPLNERIPINGVSCRKDVLPRFCDSLFDNIFKPFKDILSESEALRGCLFFVVWISVLIYSWLVICYPSLALGIVEYCIAKPFTALFWGLDGLVGLVGLIVLVVIVIIPNRKTPSRQDEFPAQTASSESLDISSTKDDYTLVSNVNSSNDVCLTVSTTQANYARRII